MANCVLKKENFKDGKIQSQFMYIFVEYIDKRGNHRSPKRNIRFCIALQFDQKFDNNIPSKTHKNYCEPNVSRGFPFRTNFSTSTQVCMAVRLS